MDDVIGRANEVNCAYDKMVKLEDLSPHPANPNDHPAHQIEIFAEVLIYQGWRRPITVSNRSGFMTRGHGALEAAKYLNLKTAPVDFQDYLSEEQELADIVADNQLSRQSVYNQQKLQEILVNLDSGLLDMKVTGFSSQQLEKMFEENNKKLPSKLSVEVGDQSETFSVNTNAGEVNPEDIDSEEIYKSSQVKMLQLFLNQKTHLEFLSIVEHYQKLWTIDNVTDTVLQILRRKFESDRNDIEARFDEKN